MSLVSILESDENIVDIHQYTLELIKEMCPSMEESTLVSTADRLIKKAAKYVEKRASARAESRIHSKRKTEEQNGGVPKKARIMNEQGSRYPKTFIHSGTKENEGDTQRSSLTVHDAEFFPSNHNRNVMYGRPPHVIQERNFHFNRWVPYHQNHRVPLNRGHDFPMHTDTHGWRNSAPYHANPNVDFKNSSRPQRQHKRNNWRRRY